MKIAGYATALLLVGGAGLAVLQAEADRRADVAVRRLLSADPGTLTIGRVDADLLRGTVVLHDIRAGSPTTRIAIGALTLPAPALSPFDASGMIVSAARAEPAAPKPAAAPTAPAPLGSASADAVVIISGDVTTTIKRIELQGTPLSNADLAAMVDGKSSEPIEARLRRLTAASITVPQVETNWIAGGFEQHSSERDIVFTDVTSGRVRAGTLGAVTVATKTADGSLKSGLASVALSGLDLAQGAHALETLRKDDGELPKPIAEAITLKGATSTSLAKGETIAVASLTIADAKMRPLRTRLQDSVARLRGAAPRDAETQAFVADLLHSIALGHGEASDIAIAKPPSADKQDATAVKSFAFDGFAEARVAHASLRQASESGGGGAVSIAALDLGDILLPSPGLDGAPARMPVPLIGTIDLKSLTVDIPPDATKPANETVPVHFQVAHATFAADGLVPDAIPAKAAFAVEHATFDVSPIEDSTRMLALIGYKQLDLSLGLASRYDAATQVLRLDRLTLEGKDMGSAALTLDLANAGQGIASANPDVQKATAIAMLFKGLVLDVKDDGLFPRSLAFKAKMDGTSIEDETQKGVDFFAATLPAMMSNDPKVMALGAAIAAFVRKPDTLHVSIQAKRGLGLLDAQTMMGDPSLLLGAVEIEAVADK